MIPKKQSFVQIAERKPEAPIGDKMPLYRMQREYTNWEEVKLEADSEEQALELAEDDDSLWDYAYDVNTYNYTGEVRIEEIEDAATVVVVETTFENKCAVLSELWLNNRDDEQFEDFIAYNDIGLPLAYILDNDIAEVNETSENFINETFDLLLVLLEIEDQGFEDFDEVMSAAE
jgi:hypothetical protein